jgi:hypothetical protein
MCVTYPYASDLPLRAVNFLANISWRYTWTSWIKWLFSSILQRCSMRFTVQTAVVLLGSGTSKILGFALVPTIHHEPLSLLTTQLPFLYSQLKAISVQSLSFSFFINPIAVSCVLKYTSHIRAAPNFSVLVVNITSTFKRDFSNDEKLF